MMTCGTELKVFEFGTFDPYSNMALDFHLLGMCDKNPRDTFIRFYTWFPRALSLGFFESDDIIDSERAQADGIHIVRRPTGGRVVLHADDLTYTVVTPKKAYMHSQVVYRMISDCIIAGISSLGVELELGKGLLGKSTARRKPCFASTSRYEVTHQGRKIVGSAQRIGKNAILQHGSIPLGRGYLSVVDYVNCDQDERERLLKEIEATTTCIHALLDDKVGALDIACALEQAFVKAFEGIVRHVSYEMFAKGIMPIFSGVDHTNYANPNETNPLDSL